MKKVYWLLKGFVAKLLLVAVVLFGHFSSGLAQDIIIEPPQPPPLVTPQPGQPIFPQPASITIAAHRVDAVIDGPVAKVHLTQIFRNDAHQTVEGRYVFPLPEDAAVSDFQMTMDGKTLEGKLLSKDEARRIYEAIVRQQRDPALLEYVGRGLFQTSVFPIPAGASRTLELSYAQILPQKDGLYQFRYPLRSQHVNANPVESLAIHLELRNQPGLRTIYSPNYNLKIERTDNTSATIDYMASQVKPESDFQLFFGTTEHTIGLNVLTYKPTGEDGFFALLAAPGVEVDSQKLVQRDVVLVLDVSGSMQGEKIAQARKAADFVVDHLNPGDHFNLISFSTGVQLWQSSLQPIDAATAKDAHRWINRLTATGSTDINRALLEALGQLQSLVTDADNRPAYLLFMTDGLPTQGEINAQRIIDNAFNNKPTQRAIRLFTFGVGFDVNTDLLDTLSQELGGRSSYVKPEEQIDEKIGEFYNQIGLPVLSSVSLDFGKQAVIDDVYPYPLPDLFAGEQLVVVGRYHSGADLTVTLQGLVNSQKIIYQYPRQHFVTSGGEPLVARLWATRKIGALLAQVRRSGANQTTGNQELIDEITNLSLQYGIVTPYTAYLVEEPSVNQTTTDAAQAAANSEPRSLYTQGAADSANKADVVAAAPASGAAAVAASEARTQLENATNVQENQAVRYVSGKTFTQQGPVVTKDGQTVDLWVDTLYKEEMQVEKVVFGSERYFALAKQPQMARWLAISPELVIVIDKSKAIRITTVEP
ncbi:hypothetical protein BH10CHL1_BH10CHL1_07740 [soil metagenome]